MKVELSAVTLSKYEVHADRRERKVVLVDWKAERWIKTDQSEKRQALFQAGETTWAKEWYWGEKVRAVGTNRGVGPDYGAGGGELKIQVQARGSSCRR